MKTCLELSIFIFLSQVSLRSVSGQSQVSLRSVPGLSQVSLRSVSGQSQVSLRSLLSISMPTSSDRWSLKYFVLLLFKKLYYISLCKLYKLLIKYMFPNLKNNVMFCPCSFHYVMHYVQVKY